MYVQRTRGQSINSICIDAGEVRIVGTPPENDVLFGIDSTPSGQLIVSLRKEYAGTLAPFDPSTGKWGDRINVPGVNGILVSDSKGCVYVTESDTQSIKCVFLSPSFFSAAAVTPTTVPRYAILTDYIWGGDLFTYRKRVSDSEPSAMRDRLWLLIQFAEAVNVMHRCGMVHRDIKPSNALLTTDKPPTLKLADFGLSRYIKAATGTVSTDNVLSGTTNYMAPEQTVPESKLTAAVDVYAFGGVIYFMLFGIEPWSNSPTVIILAALAARKTPSLPELCMNSNATSDQIAARDGLISLMKSCYAVDPEKRPRMGAILTELYRIFDQFMWPKSLTCAGPQPPAAPPKSERKS